MSGVEVAGTSETLLRSASRAEGFGVDRRELGLLAG